MSFRILLLCLGIFWPLAVFAEPFMPTDDTQVLERLRTAPLDKQSQELRQRRAELARDPSNLKLAVDVAKSYIEQGRAEFDPRYYGRAQAVLKPWWEAPQPPAVVVVLRAIIRQGNHDFTGALEDLAFALRLDPSDPQAWVARALVLQVRGEYAEAKRHCLQLVRLSTELVAVTCMSSVASFNGQAAKSYALLRRIVERTTEATPRERLWALTVLADIAMRTGQSHAAEEHFKQALALGLSDNYLLGLYTDFLLDQGRPAEVVALLQEETRPDGLLLRLALAEQMVRAPTLAGHIADLQARFAASRARNDTRHQREEARFTLQLLQQPQEALRLAQENWTVQREPEDARILLESALAAHDTATAQPVLDWLAERGLEDVRLAQLHTQLRGVQP
jgi:tetratricopeptide (TPR) repeat protein